MMNSNQYNIMELITTYDGTTAYRKDCRFIKGSYYIKNKQCFYINGVWYRINSNFVLFDYEKQSWVLKEDNQNLYNGIVKIQNDNTLEFGYFTPNNEKNISFFYKGSYHIAINVEIFKDCEDILEGMNGAYYFSNEKGLPREIIMKISPKKENFYSFPFNYSSDTLIPDFDNYYKDNFKGSSLSSSHFVFIEDYTFGIEFETDKGAIPEKYLMKNGLIACRDGSIRGFEYTTIPLWGSKGIQTIKEVCKLLSKYCECSPRESLHIHLGGYTKSIKAISSLYRLGLLIESEIYSMFPYFYVDTSKFKRKSYCGPLPRIDESNKSNIPMGIFSPLYYYLSNGSTYTGKFPTDKHPMDRSGQHKWEVSPRYLWMNMIPIIWGDRGTIEFRCHIPTIMEQKVINWLFIVIAILKYAKKEATYLTSTEFKKLKPISLQEIINNAYPKDLALILNTYIKNRKMYYADKNDNIGEIEVLNESRGFSSITLEKFI